MEKIINLKKGDVTVEDHVTKYKILLRKAKIPEDSPPAIDYTAIWPTRMCQLC